jgi:hypothetical protein
MPAKNHTFSSRIEELEGGDRVERRHAGTYSPGKSVGIGL